MGISVKVGPKYQVVIPQSIRKKVGIQPQDEVLVEEVEGTVVIIPRPKTFARFMVGLGKEAWKGIEVKKYLKRERESWQ